MAVAEQVPSAVIIASGDTTVFPYSFLVQTAEDMVASVDNVEFAVGYYSINGLGQLSGGTVVFGSAPPQGARVVLERRTKLTRSTVFDDIGDFRAAVLNADLDRPMLALQEIQAKTARFILSAVDDPTLVFPSTLGSPNSFLGTDGAGNLIFTEVPTSQAALDSLASSDLDAGAFLVTYKSAAAGAIARSLSDLFNDEVRVTSFMTPAQIADVRSNAGTLDTSAAWQAAINYAVLTGRKVRAPAGSYLLNAAVTVTSADVMIEGDGQEITKILVNNATGGIFFAQGIRAGAAYMGGVRGLTFVANGSGNVLRGTALSFIYAIPSQAPATPHLVVSDVSFRSVAYDASVGNPRFTTCLYIKNAQCVQVEKLASNQNGNNACTAIYLDYDLVTPAYRVSLRSLSLEGHQYGVRAIGAIENLLITDYEIAAPQFGIYCDASGVDHMTPLLTILGGHVNGTNRAISVINWASVQIDQPNVAIFTGAFTTDASVFGVYLQSCIFVEWTGGIINSLGAGSAATVLMQLSGCTRFTVTGLVGYINHSATGTQRALQIDSASSRGVITGNHLESVNGLGETGIFVQTNSGVDDRIAITGNVASGFANGTWLINEYGVKVRSNDFSGCTIPVKVTGTPVSSTVIKDNYPVNGRAALTGATPNVGSMPDGRITITQGGATTITNFLSGYDGMELDILFADGNTTVAHNSVIFLQGSVAATFAVSTILRLKFEATAGIWFEMGRRT